MSQSSEKFIKTIYVAGPNFRDKIRVEASTLEELEPTYVEANGLTYERYGDEEEYDEIRFDYIVSRSVIKKTERRDIPAPEEE